MNATSTSPASPRATAEYRAVVVGATGAVGSALAAELLASPRCIGVTALVRRDSSDLMTLPGAHGKLAVNLVQMHRLESETSAALSFSPPHRIAFCTLGVGQPRKVSREEHWRVDVEYATAFARGCRTAGVEHFSLLTSVGANAGSPSRYLRVKGSVERAVRELAFARTSFFRPSLLVTEEIRYGLQDRITQAIFPRISALLPPRFHEIRVEDLARAMRINAERPASEPVEELEYPQMYALLHRD